MNLGVLDYDQKTIEKLEIVSALFESWITRRRPIELLSEQGDTAYSSSTNHVYLNIARQRSDRAQKHENSLKISASEGEILLLLDPLKNRWLYDI